MDLCVLISKPDLAAQGDLGSRLSRLSRKVMDLDDSCRYYPLRGGFVAFMSVLLQYDLDYALEHDHAVT